MLTPLIIAVSLILLPARSERITLAYSSCLRSLLLILPTFLPTLPPHRNVKIVLLTHIVLAIRHRQLPPYINSLCRDGAFQALRFSVLRSFQYLLKPDKGEPETETGNRLTKTRFHLSAVVLSIFAFLQFLCCFRFQRRKSLAAQGFSRKPIWQRIGY